MHFRCNVWQALDKEGRELNQCLLWSSKHIWFAWLWIFIDFISTAVLKMSPFTWGGFSEEAPDPFLTASNLGVTHSLFYSTNMYHAPPIANCTAGICVHLPKIRGMKYCGFSNVRLFYSFPHFLLHLSLQNLDTRSVLLLGGTYTTLGPQLHWGEVLKLTAESKSML